jgi:non-ribosomal peptide synthetase-like protein
MSPYLALMGTKVGRDVWCDTLTITEFDTVTLDDDCSLNRRCCIETHLFHDRVMSIGPIRIGAGASVGPSSAILPDAILGDGCSVGGRAVVLRGESLPPHTRWHGAPVEAR